MHGIDDNQRFFAYVTSLPHVIELQNTDDALNLHPQLAAQVYGKFKEVVSDVVWRNKDSCRNIWFSPDSGSSGMPEGEALDEFRVLPNPSHWMTHTSFASVLTYTIRNWTGQL